MSFHENQVWGSTEEASKQPYGFQRSRMELTTRGSKRDMYKEKTYMYGALENRKYLQDNRMSLDHTDCSRFGKSDMSYRVYASAVALSYDGWKLFCCCWTVDGCSLIF